MDMYRSCMQAKRVRAAPESCRARAQREYGRGGGFMEPTFCHEQISSLQVTFRQILQVKVTRLRILIHPACPSQQ